MAHNTQRSSQGALYCRVKSPPQITPCEQALCDRGKEKVTFNGKQTSGRARLRGPDIGSV